MKEQSIVSTYLHRYASFVSQFDIEVFKGTPDYSDIVASVDTATVDHSGIGSLDIEIEISC